MKHQDTPKTIKVVARAPFQVYYEGPASLLSAANSVGKFDILPGHADFFSVLSAGEVNIETDKGPVSFMITNGIISVRSDEAMVFVNM